MESQECVEIFEKFTWKIENFSRMKAKEIYSEPFVLGGYPWRIILYPLGNNVDDLSIYLEAMQTANMSIGWSRDVKFKLLVFNQIDINMTITEESKKVFNANENHWGYPSFMPLVELQDPQNGFIVMDVCTVGAEVFVCKPTDENRVSQAASLTGHTRVEVPRPRPEVQCSNLETHSPVYDLTCSEPSMGEIIEQLEEVSSRRPGPSLVEPQPKRRREFTDSAFATLGKLLYFLKTRKVRDMNEEACKELRVLWDEVEKYRFDLTWLAPHVQSALGMKSYVEKAMEVENLKDSVAGLELETERLKAKLVAAEVNVEIEKDLLKEKGFEEINLDSELECGSWRPQTQS